MLVHLEVLVVWHEFQVDYSPSLIAQSLTNQLALSPGSPSRPSNSGDEVRFVLHTVYQYSKNKFSPLLPKSIVGATSVSGFRQSVVSSNCR